MLVGIKLQIQWNEKEFTLKILGEHAADMYYLIICRVEIFSNHKRFESIHPRYSCPIFMFSRFESIEETRMCYCRHCLD